MATDAEQQAEEIEVLHSIYEGDENFKQVDATTYQYKYTEGEKSFILEIKWGTTYPTEKPTINLEIFYNQHLLSRVKKNIMALVDAEAEKWVGYATTYTLFEYVKDKLEEILAEQIEETIVTRVEKINIDDQAGSSKKPEKKEQLSKAQKRRAWDRAEIGKAGEKPRGWDWVDIIKHLSQTPQQPSPSTSTC